VTGKQGEVRIRNVKVRNITALPPELLASGPWRSLLNGKLRDRER
jgi:hypothetical protein